MIAVAISGLATAGLAAVAMKNGVVYFYSPADIAAGKAGADRAIRIGGLVKPGSVVKENGEIRFIVTDGTHDVPTVFYGLPPALFAEGQGTVATGRLNDKGTFLADQVLAKHDERYMPPEVSEALKKSGRWGEGGH